MAKGNVFNIQKFSIHDGPGIRTTVFLKGCPLACKWCHNPESLSREKQILINHDKCIRCGTCIKICPTNALYMEEDKLNLNKCLCNYCGDCEIVCIQEAIEVVGKEMTDDEVIAEVEKDKVFYDVTGGGVTFSGGEPFYQPKFLAALVRKAKEKSLHVTIDTSGMTLWENIENVLDYVDLYLYDLKMIDSEKHKKYIGSNNKIILENLKRLDKELDKREGSINLRLIMLKGINDSEEDINLILDFISDLNNISQINLLEYHTMGREKYSRLNLEYEMSGDEKPDDYRLKSIKKIFEKNNYQVVIGG